MTGYEDQNLALDDASNETPGHTFELAVINISSGSFGTFFLELSPWDILSHASIVISTAVVNQSVNVNGPLIQSRE